MDEQSRIALGTRFDSEDNSRRMIKTWYGTEVGKA